MNLTNTVADVLENGLRCIELGLLQQDSHGVSRAQDCITVAGGVQARHDLENCRLTGAVGAHHADFCAGEKRHRDVVEN